MPKLAFKPLIGYITLPALAMVKDQWKLLYHSPRAECTGHFRKQYLLPCSHDLQRVFDSGELIPRSLVHPRWYIHGETLSSQSWQPTYGKEAETTPEVGRNMAIEIDRLLDARNALVGEHQRSFDRLIFDTIDKLIRECLEFTHSTLPIPTHVMLFTHTIFRFPPNLYGDKN